jgi:hypothetical protein
VLSVRPAMAEENMVRAVGPQSLPKPSSSSVSTTFPLLSKRVKTESLSEFETAVLTLAQSTAPPDGTLKR